MPRKNNQTPQRRSRPPAARSWRWIGGVAVVLPLNVPSKLQFLPEQRHSLGELPLLHKNVAHLSHGRQRIQVTVSQSASAPFHRSFGQ